MKKYDNKSLERLRKKRERKGIKRKNKLYNSHKNTSSLLKLDRNKPDVYYDNIIAKSYSATYHHFNDNGFHIDKLSGNSVDIPKDFSFYTNYDESLKCIKQVFSSIYSLKFLKKDNIFVINFSKCVEIEASALLLLQTIVLDYFTFSSKISKGFGLSNKYNQIMVTESSDDTVNNILQAQGFPGRGYITNTPSIPIYSLRVVVGNRNKKKHNEQSKLIICVKVRKFINTCLKRSDMELTQTGVNSFDNMIGEILNNSEDHSNIDNWFLTGNLFEYKDTSDKDDVVGELNLVFLNLGDSFYDGFEKSKKINKENYSQMEELYNRFINKNYKFLKSPFSKENLITLYALQEGYSRLHYENEGRGTGSMTFIRSFFDIGNFQNKSKGIIPRLSIYTGNTSVCITNDYLPFKNGKKYFLSLNKEENLIEPPSTKHLKKLKNRFPGTMLSVKMFITKGKIMNEINIQQNDN